MCRLTVTPLAATSVAFHATVLGPVLTASPDTPPLRGILARAGVWVVRYEAELGSLIAEEHYWQEAGSVSGRFAAALRQGVRAPELCHRRCHKRVSSSPNF